MLHIILTILKIAGILLLVLLLLVVGLVLAALFVPLRYHLQAVHTQENTQGEVRITWMLHLISVRIFFKPISGEAALSRDALHLKLRILGIDPLRVSSFLNKKKKQKNKQETAHNQAHQPEHKQTVKQIEKTKQDTSKQEKKKVSDFEEQMEFEKQSDFKEQTDFEEQSEFEEQPEHEGQQKVRKLLNFFLHKFSHFCGTIRTIPKRFERLKRKIRKILKTPGELSLRVSAFRRKLEKYEAGEVLQETFSRLKQMLRHFRIRKGKGFVRFGTGDPALTGELTGLLYLIFPASCGEISLEPQFTETMLEMELQVAGHIRLIHLLTALWWAFRNRKLRMLIRVLRKD